MGDGSRMRWRTTILGTYDANVSSRFFFTSLSGAKSLRSPVVSSPNQNSENMDIAISRTSLSVSDEFWPPPTTDRVFSNSLATVRSRYCRSPRSTCTSMSSSRWRERSATSISTRSRCGRCISSSRRASRSNRVSSRGLSMPASYRKLARWGRRDEAALDAISRAAFCAAMGLGTEPELERALSVLGLPTWLLPRSLPRESLGGFLTPMRSRSEMVRFSDSNSASSVECRLSGSVCNVN
mmetsp:Transcript_1375/g.4321  ORF Transcript_1375/g.4321 Transcript_1375/m.4321 type:complete len:239 (-) Transcript_1375:237-953(-)